MIQPKNQNGPLVIMVALFFLFGSITVLNDVLVPHMKNIFHLTTTQSTMVQFSFFLPYLLLSLPAGWLIGQVGYKKVIMIALGIMSLGLFLFISAVSYGVFEYFLVSLFVLGAGLTLAQVAANPYIIALGPIDTGSSRLNLAGGMNSFATSINTIIGGSLLFVGANASIVEKIDAMKFPYFIMAGIVLLYAIVIGFSKLPHIRYASEQATGSNLAGIWQYKHLLLGAGAIFAYVGAEVSIGTILIDFLQHKSMGGFSEVDAKWFVTMYWMGAMIGRFVGFFTLQKIKTERGLLFVSIMAVYLVFICMFTSGTVARTAIVMVGLCNSIMWPCIFPLSLSGLGKYTSQGAGLLCSMIVGGALIPMIQAFLAEETGLGYNYSFIIVLLCYIYILYFALVGHKVAAKEAEIYGHTT